MIDLKKLRKLAEVGCSTSPDEVLELLDMLEAERVDSERKWKPSHVNMVWSQMGIDMAGFSWGAFVYRIKDAQEYAMKGKP